jgi:hypothetical protein
VGSQETGARRQEPGDRRQEPGARSQETDKSICLVAGTAVGQGLCFSPGEKRGEAGSSGAQLRLMSGKNGENGRGNEGGRV